MAASVEPADLPKIARAAGRSGKDLPEWAAGKPDLEDAYYDGAGVTPPARAKSSASKAAKTSQQSTPSTAPSTRASTSPSKGAASLDPGNTAAPWRPRLVPGTGGGLLLAVFAYPLTLALIEHGADGATAWLNAKFRNKVTTTTKGK